MWDIRKPRAKSADEQEKRYAIPEQSFEPVIRAGDGGKGPTREAERSETVNRTP
jgi:hypothetical protein